ncbi:MAG: hypothetical protein KDH17_06855 [Rhodocyclaceae bacterium]|nr:hypothetical protein [Rhodocyclaceae bacterium]MCP5233641.1 hypothetical protein [Zoogloeaceae bacterium]
MVPHIEFDTRAVARIAQVCSHPDFLQRIKDLAGQFALEDELIRRAPTSADLRKTLEDLEKRVSNFIDGLRMLRGHDLEGIIDNAVFEVTKELPPDRGELERLTWEFRRQVWIAQRKLDDLVPQTKIRTADPIRELASWIAWTMDEFGVTWTTHRDGQLATLTLTCLEAAGCATHTQDTVHHYLPKKRTHK